MYTKRLCPTGQNMFRVMNDLPSVEWGMQKEIDYDTDYQESDAQTTHRNAKQKTLLDYPSN